MHFLFSLLYTKLHYSLQVFSQTEHCLLPCSRSYVILWSQYVPGFRFNLFVSHLVLVTLCGHPPTSISIVNEVQGFKNHLFSAHAWVRWLLMSCCGGSLCSGRFFSLRDHSISHAGSMTSVLWCDAPFLFSLEKWAKPSVSFILHLKTTGLKPIGDSIYLLFPLFKWIAVLRLSLYSQVNMGF